MSALRHAGAGITLAAPLLAAMVLAAPAAVAASGEPAAFRCGMEEVLGSARAGAGPGEGQLASIPCTAAPPISPLKPRNKVLVIFVQYVNENPHPASPCWDGWPVGSVPVWADSLISPATDPAQFPVGSFNDYFYMMSGGRHYIYGNYYPQIVTLDYWLEWYRDHVSVADLCQEIIDKVDPDVNFADYDVEPQDGVVDMVFILSRTDLPWGWQGSSYLGRETLTTDDFQGSTPVTLNGCYPGSGTLQFVANHIGALGIAGHEYMHQVFVPAAAVGENPYAFPGDTFHLRYLSSYGLMDGNGGGTVMSAFERAWLGWTEPQEITTTTLGVRFPDAATTGFSARVRVDPAEPDEYWLIENRQRLSYYDGLQGDAGPTECCNNELESTGLMIYHVDLRDLPGEFPGAARKTVDIEAADGMIDPETGAPDPIGGLDGLDDPLAGECRADTVGNDAFTPTLYPRFGPNTNPNTNGYLFAEPFGPWTQPRPSGFQLLNIRYDPGDPTHTTLLADIILNR